MRGKILFILLMLILLANTVKGEGVKKTAWTEIDGISYRIYIYDNSEGKATVMKKNDASYQGNIVIPEYITYQGKQYQVAFLQDYAFMNCKGLTSVTLPGSISSISMAAFSLCTGLRSVILPEGVQSIHALAFGGCSNLEYVSIPSTIRLIESDAFYKTEKLKEVSAPQKMAQRLKGYVGYNVRILTEGQQPTYTASNGQAGRSSASPTMTAPRQVSEIDKNIPTTGKQDRQTFAVIIGNEKYESESSVPFATQDALVFKEYVKKTLGVPEKQIKYIHNGGLNTMRMAVRWLKQAMEVCDGQGKGIFYYVGHGIPNESDKSAYLLPVDGMSGDVESAYPLSRLYQELGNIPAQQIMVFLDASFSGAKREGGMLASARGVAVKAKSVTPKGNLVVFTASQDDETAFAYKSQQHGMFTYYLLKKLQETKGETTLGALSDYLTTEVKRQAFEENNKTQTPTVIPSQALTSNWQTMKLR